MSALPSLEQRLESLTAEQLARLGARLGLPDEEAAPAQLAAYAAPHPGAALDLKSVRAFLGERLPRHMTPSRIIAVDSLPRTPNGKVDRQALAQRPDEEQAAVAEAPSGTATEQSLIAIWQEVLGTGRIGPQDDFFQLGGHSLLAIQVLSRVSEKMGVTLPLRSLFDHPTIAGLAAAVDKKRAEPAKPAADGPKLRKVRPSPL